MTWPEALSYANFAAWSTRRRWRVYRLATSNGRTRWCTEPIGGWTP